MSWRIVFRPEVEADVTTAAEWYEARQPGLGAEFVEQVIVVWNGLAENPLLNARGMRAKTFAGATRKVFLTVSFTK